MATPPIQPPKISNLSDAASIRDVKHRRGSLQGLQRLRGPWKKTDFVRSQSLRHGKKDDADPCKPVDRLLRNRPFSNQQRREKRSQSLEMPLEESLKQIKVLIGKIWDAHSRLELAQTKANDSPRLTRRKLENPIDFLRKKINKKLGELAEVCALCYSFPEKEELPPGKLEELIPKIGSCQAKLWFETMLRCKKEFLPFKHRGDVLEEKVYRSTLECLVERCFSRLPEDKEFLVPLLCTMYVKLNRIPFPSEIIPAVENGDIEEELIEAFAKKCLEQSLDRKRLTLPPMPRSINPIYDKVCISVVKRCLREGFVREIMLGSSGVYQTGVRGDRKNIALFVIKPFSEEFGRSFSPRGKNEEDRVEKADLRAFADLGPVNQIISSRFLGKPWSFVADLEHEKFKCGKGRCLIMEYVPSIGTLARLFDPKIHRDELWSKLLAKGLAQKIVDEELHKYDSKTEELFSLIRETLGIDLKSYSNSPREQKNESFDRIARGYFSLDSVRNIADCDLRFCSVDSNFGNVLLLLEGQGKLDPVQIDAFRQNPQTFYGLANTPWWLKTSVAEEPLQGERKDRILAVNIEEEIAQKRKLSEMFDITYTDQGQDLDRAHMIFFKSVVRRGWTRSQIWDWIGREDPSIFQYLAGVAEEDKDVVENVGGSYLNTLFLRAKTASSEREGNFWQIFEQWVEKAAPLTP